MSSKETMIPVIGNLTGDPELRFTPSGSAVANFTIASTPERWDKNKGEFVKQDTLFMRCSIWREAAENVAESLTKGMKVIAYGKLIQRSYETREGEKRTVVEMQVDEIGPSLTFATAKVTRSQRSSGGHSGGSNTPAPPNGPDPWVTSGNIGRPSNDDEPPF